MKFKCIDNRGMESRLTLNKIYDGEYALNKRDDAGRPHIRIEADDAGHTTLYVNYRFELVLEAC
jgi:hypothetical protein